MKVLVIGSGGREHALAWKFSHSPLADRLFCAPGNAGIAALADCVDVSASDLEGLVKFARDERIDFTVVGPEAPLCEGIVDRFQEAGLRIFGPTAAAAELEGDKGFAKRVMNRYRIPTAGFRPFRNAGDAREYLRSLEVFPVVVKAAGLAAGKGVLICPDHEAALEAVDDMMLRRRFGDAGAEVVIEEHLKGEEASILALTDGRTIAVMESSQDHKAAFDGDRGPNTGGMGAYSPAPVVTPRLMQEIESDVLVPIVHAMNREGRAYRGVLYAGLMITPGGPKVLEFNVRFGDPEAQALLLRLDSDLLEALMAVERRELDRIQLEWNPQPAVCVVMASGGYPGGYDSGKAIEGLDGIETGPDLQVFHSGTGFRDGKIVTSGGRVLGVTARGDSVRAAKERAYSAVRRIRFDLAHFRTDIADRAIARDSGGPGSSC
jgi:phosphoribosylamine--glycine ligase